MENPSAARHVSSAGLAIQASLIAFGLLTYAAGAGHAEPPLMSVLKHLGLRTYESSTAPPQFSGVTLDGRKLSMSEQRGRVVILNFWASWCLECRPEMAMLDRLQRAFSPRGLAIIGVNARESTDAVERYAKELGLTFPIVLDPDGKINAVYGVIGLPTTFVVDRDGHAIAFAVGPRQWESAPLRAVIESLLKEPASDKPLR